MKQKYTAPIRYQVIQPTCRFCGKLIEDLFFIENQVDERKQMAFYNPESFSHQRCMTEFTKALLVAFHGEEV